MGVFVDDMLRQDRQRFQAQLTDAIRTGSGQLASTRPPESTWHYWVTRDVV